MCGFCRNDACTLTKKQVMERGAILESNANGIARLPEGVIPQIYTFEGIPVFYSLSALIPDEEEANPHVYKRFIYDRYRNAICECRSEVKNPLALQTEREFMERRKNMKIMTSVNSKGELGVMCMTVRLRGSGGELGEKAVKGLSPLIKELREAETEEKIIKSACVILGYTSCCLLCGFLDEESADNLMEMVEHMSEKVLRRAQEKQ